MMAAANAPPKPKNFPPKGKFKGKGKGKGKWGMGDHGQGYFMGGCGLGSYGH